MEKHNKPVKDKFLSFALTLMALSIAYLSYSLLSISQHIPEILEQVSRVSGQVDRTTENIEPLLDSVPDILKTVEKTTDSIPAVLNEVAEVRKIVPSVLSEVEAVRGSLPAVLDRVDSLQSQVAQLQKQLPAILSTVNDVTAAVRETNQRVDQIIPLVPEALGEVEKTRAEIPGYLTRVEKIVENTKGISEEAGKGAVTGFFKGIVSTPFELIKGTEGTIRSSLKNERLLTEEDFELVYEASAKLLQSDDQSEQTWRNPSTGNGGLLKVVKAYQYKGAECRTIQLTFKTKKGAEESVDKDFCVNSDGKWEPVE